MSKDSSEVPQSPWPEFFNQIKSFPWKAVGKRACGPTAVAMAINRLRNQSVFSDKISPLDIAFHASKINSLPGDRVQNKLLVESSDDTKGYIAIGDIVDDSLIQDIEIDKANGKKIILFGAIPQEIDYKPVFTLNRGWDHRGSETFFAQYGIKAKKLGDPSEEKISLEMITEQLRSKNMFIASVEHKDDSSHLVLISGIDDDQVNPQLLINDPLEQGPQWVSATEWYTKNFRGYGTLIYNTQDTKE